MLELLEAPFFKTDSVFEEVKMNYLRRHLPEGENIISELPIYKSGEVFAFFTDKRILLTNSPDTFDELNRTNEIEFLPYKSIERYIFLEATSVRKYKLDIIVSEETKFSFFLTDLSDTMKILELIGKNNM